MLSRLPAQAPPAPSGTAVCSSSAPLVGIVAEAFPLVAIIAANSSDRVFPLCLTPAFSPCLAVNERVSARAPQLARVSPHPHGRPSPTAPARHLPWWRWWRRRCRSRTRGRPCRRCWWRWCGWWSGRRRRRRYPWRRRRRTGGPPPRRHPHHHVDAASSRGWAPHRRGSCAHLAAPPAAATAAGDVDDRHA